MNKLEEFEVNRIQGAMSFIGGTYDGNTATCGSKTGCKDDGKDSDQQ